jgi:hypothetical protein
MTVRHHTVLLEVCVSEIEQLPFICLDSLTRLTRVTSDFLQGLIPYPEAHAAFMFIIGCTGPLEHVRAILEIPDEPLPPCEEDETSARKRMRMWSTYEDNRLLAGLYRYGVNNWAPISHFVGNSRSRSQCAQRWARGLNPHIRKASWDPSEDLRLIQLVNTYGEKSWMKVSASMGNRSDVQCRYHYLQLAKDKPELVRMSALGAFPTLGDGQRPIAQMAVNPAFGAAPSPRFSMPACREVSFEPGQRRRLSESTIGAMPFQPAAAPRQNSADEDQKEMPRFPSVESLMNPLH